MFRHFGLENVAVAGQDEADFPISDEHHGFQPAQIAVGAPILGQLHAGAQQLAGILVEFGLKPLEQREGVGGRAGEAADHVALGEAAHLAGIAFDDGLADRDLAVAADHRLSALADHDDGGRVPGGGAFRGVLRHEFLWSRPAGRWRGGLLPIYGGAGGLASGAAKLANRRGPC